MTQTEEIKKYYKEKKIKDLLIFIPYWLYKIIEHKSIPQNKYCLPDLMLTFLKFGRINLFAG